MNFSSKAEKEFCQKLQPFVCFFILQQKFQRLEDPEGGPRRQEERVDMEEVEL